MMRRSRSGFTLTEMLAVVAILTLLLGLLLPSFRGVQTASRNMQCQRKLHNLYTAWWQVRTDAAQGEVAKFSTANWMAQLHPYLNESDQVFICPEHDYTDRPPGDEERLEDYKIWDKDGEYLIELISGPAALQLSQTQFNDLFPGAEQNMRQMRDTDDDFDQQAPPYQPDGSGIYYLMIEDLRTSDGSAVAANADRDFSDLIVRVEDGNSDLRITIWRGDAGHDFQLRDYGQTPFRIIHDGIRRNFREPIEYAIENQYGSYGLNKELVEAVARPDPSKILFMDYERAVIKTIGENVQDWQQWEDPRVGHSFNRHNNRTNVIFADGGVVQMQSNQINPDRTRVLEDYWLP